MTKSQGIGAKEEKEKADINNANKKLTWKTFKHSEEPEDKLVVLVYFSDDILN